MNAIVKISDNIKSLLCASSQINSCTKAVQELVFNSIDAEATSIAVRIHIEDGKVQVIDNGCGINKNDFEVLGQNYMTSKLVDIATLKAMPDKYGFRGQSLANIVQVSKFVKITSRCEQSEETFTKTFEFGKEKQIVKSKARPSKGTTVEIKGFLYNLSIQKKCSNFLIEIQDIKSFLESTSLVHYNISISLRDDSTYDIVFKINKNRDIYQTLSNLYGLEEKDVQKLQVEKNQYKVIAYIAKRDNESTKQLIFINGMLLTGDSNLRKAVNCRFSKQIKSNRAEKYKKLYDNQEESKNDGIPFYVIFFKCPYLDYSLRITSKITMVDFKDWTEINKLIAKLVHFYNGDSIRIKEMENATSNIKEVHKNKNTNTNDQVKQIINKILGSKPKAPVVSQMHNGVKGNRIKRKHKKRTQAKLTISKNIDHKTIKENSVKQASLDAFTELENAEINFANAEKHNIISPAGNKSKDKKTKKIVTAEAHNVGNSVSKSNLRSEHKNEYNKISEKKKHICTTKTRNNAKLRAKLALHCKFNIPTDTIKQRNKILSKEANKLKNKSIPLERQPKRDMILKETIKYCNVSEKNKNISIRKKMNEVTIYESFPMLPHKLNIDVETHKINSEKNSLLSTYDILRTILTQQNSQKEPYNVPNATETETRNINHDLHLERANHISDHIGGGFVTFNSHNYKKTNMGFDYVSHNLIKDNNDYLKQNENVCNVFRNPKAFISKKSMDNFVSKRGNPKLFFKNKSFQSKRNYILKNTLKKAFNNRKIDINKNILSNKEQSSYTIQFSESNDCNFNKYINDFNAFDSQILTIRNNTEESTSEYMLIHTPCMINLSGNPELSNYLFHSSDVLQTANNVVKNTTVNAYMNEEICISYEQLHNHGTYTTDEGIFKSYADNIKIHHDDLERYEESYLNHATYTIEPQNNTVLESVITDSSDSITKVDDDIGSNLQNNNKLIITDPIQVCETILDSRETLRNEFETSFNKTNDSFHKSDKENNTEIAPDETKIANNINHDDGYLDIEQIMNEIQTSHHFIASNIIGGNVTEMENNNGFVGHDEHFNDNNEHFEGNANAIDDVINFKMQDRLDFLPKGMSQIFRNTNLKINCDPISIQDYYNDNLYNEFAHKVRNTLEIFEPKIQEARDLVTKDIDKVNIKLKKDNASLKFDGESLKNCQVLGQVDEKFVAVIMQVKCNDSENLSEFLVLFDQHAVHERIRLETNLADYFTGTEWNTENLDEVTLKVSSDDVRFLHNYKEKFTQFGLQWTILDNNDLSLNAIPKAILGKNPRPVDKIIKAVQSLIKEVIDNVKLQSGCVPLYPKSIMDLVFSEACRYAIKFGDQLSKADCIELIRKLSDCKTPFQCAHGRPVMAVIMDNKRINSSYMISLNKLREVRKKLAPRKKIN